MSQLQKKAQILEPKAGVFYMVPEANHQGHYSVIAETTDDSEDPLHLMLWDRVKKLLEHRFKKIISDQYMSIPRGRVIPPVDVKGTWILAWGNDFPLSEYKSEILSAFQLHDIDSLGKLEVTVDNHEKMNPQEQKIIEADLKIKITPTGWKFSKK